MTRIVPSSQVSATAFESGIEFVKQANNANLAPVDGLALYAGNDEIFARTLDLGGAGGILVASHLVGEEMRRMVDEPQERAAIDEELRDVYTALSVTSNPIPVKRALNMLGLPVGGLRSPLVEADYGESQVIGAMLARRGLQALAHQ